MLAVNAHQRKARNRANTGALGRKKPNRNGWALDKWWSWGDLNPRPQAFFEQIYMFSGLI